LRLNSSSFTHNSQVREEELSGLEIAIYQNNLNIVTG
jgi:hypothetical protein